MHDHDTSLQRALLSLEGLSVGDALGERFFWPHVREGMATQTVPEAPWYFTDDTEMALSIVEVLREHRSIDQDALAAAFARRFMKDPGRGYGAGAYDLLGRIARGEPWRPASRGLFSGQGSMGNGGAMRVAPLGAYFASDVGALLENAKASGEVTHAHPEGQAGALAVALAAAAVVNGADLFGFVLEHLPPSETRDGIAEARSLPKKTQAWKAAQIVGSGSRVISQDTVPFSLWCAARNLRDFPGALWESIEGASDIDTVCAIVGGIVVLATGLEGIPATWRASREPLPR